MYLHRMSEMRANAAIIRFFVVARVARVPSHKLAKVDESSDSSKLFLAFFFGHFTTIRIARAGVQVCALSLRPFACVFCREYLNCEYEY